MAEVQALLEAVQKWTQKREELRLKFESAKGHLAAKMGSTTVRITKINDALQEGIIMQKSVGDLGLSMMLPPDASMRQVLTFCCHGCYSSS